MGKSKGVIHHPHSGRKENVDVKGKRCAVIGTGASGAQAIQVLGPITSEIRVFQRMPNLALPMQRPELTVAEQVNAKILYPEIFKYRETAFSGFHCNCLQNADANKESYKICAKTRDHIVDPQKRNLLAPLEMPHLFGVRLSFLETNYFEKFNRPGVDVVDIRTTPSESLILLESFTIQCDCSCNQVYMSFQ
ncbi:hypothetical protein F5X97DRAFT_321703 [Nemania serpens]|nr:hypothetical protein F5X97DRAFT_321703 [Nemania serpens]